MPLAVELALYAGVHVLVVAVAELVQRSSIASATLLVASFCLYLPRARTRGLSNLKYWLVYLVSAVWMFRDRLDADGTLFRALLLANVLLMAIPPLYNRNVPMAAVVIALSFLTPRTEGELMSPTYLRAYATVFATYIAFSGPFQNNTLGSLSSVTPMAVGLLTQNATRTIALRIVGMHVQIMLDSIPLFGVSHPPSDTPFRHALRPALFTALADAVSHATDRDSHPLFHAASLFVSAASMVPLFLQRL